MTPVHFNLDHIGLAATSPNLLRDWYTAVFHATEVWRSPEVEAYLLRIPGGSLIEIYPALSRPTPEIAAINGLAGWRHLALRVPNLDAAILQLDQHNVSWRSDIRPAGGGGCVRFFSDPEGNLWHLVERSHPDQIPLPSL